MEQSTQQRHDESWTSWWITQQIWVVTTCRGGRIADCGDTASNLNMSIWHVWGHWYLSFQVDYLTTNYFLGTYQRLAQLSQPITTMTAATSPETSRWMTLLATSRRHSEVEGLDTRPQTCLRPLVCLFSLIFIWLFIYWQVDSRRRLPRRQQQQHNESTNDIWQATTSYLLFSSFLFFCFLFLFFGFDIIVSVPWLCTHKLRMLIS